MFFHELALQYLDTQRARGRMKLENWVRVRLNESQMLIYTAEAEARGADITREELSSIRAAMIDMGEAMDELRDQVAERLAPPGQDREATGEPGAMEIETLLLLRALSTSQNRQMVTGEIERQGLKPFRIPGPPTRSR
jgi:hypothetical protein